MLRAVLFNIAFYINTLLWGILFVPIFFLPRKVGFFAIRHLWAGSSIWLMKVISGIRAEIRGLENLPTGIGYIVASKHQSTWETLNLVPLFPQPTFILKRQLMYIPIFGWYTTKMRQIPVDRGKRAAAMKSMAGHARRAIKEERQILIFPEGTRKAPADPPKYKFGVAHLYSELGTVCVPIAHNAGLYWPRRTMKHYPGTVVMEILPPIAPGMPPQEFLSHLQETIEEATDRLLAEAARSPSPPPISQKVQEHIDSKGL